ncbi:MAG: hypothetical protein JW776_05770 [Candidatus Lokiarchaeota archaeon]|nr:hypothetical protein [Candidatus Lokiarchaeota archaeon]
MDIWNTLIGWLGGLGTVAILIFVGLIVLSFILQVLFLKIGVKAVKGSNIKFGAVFVTALINLLVGWIPCIGCILVWVVINARHKTGFGNAILAWLIAIVIPWAISFGIAFLISLTGILTLPF